MHNKPALKQSPQATYRYLSIVLSYPACRIVSEADVDGIRHGLGLQSVAREETLQTRRVNTQSERVSTCGFRGTTQ